MSKPIPVLILTPAGDVATPIQASDLIPMAKDATLAALPQPNTKITVVTVSLVAAVVNQAVAMGTLTQVETVVVKALTGAAATLKFGAVTEAAIPLVQGEVRNNLNVGALYLNSPGGAGGTITLEIQGR